MTFERDIPPSPPASVLEEVDAAFARAEQLRATGRELHFGLDAITARVVIQIRTLRGDVLRSLSPMAALDFITAGTL
jgi:hypothetical protein